MLTIHPERLGNRRDFLGKLAGTAALLGMSNLTLTAAPGTEKEPGFPPGEKLSDPDEWFKANIKGKHKIVFDAPAPKEMMTFAWPKVFLLTNAGTGTTEKDCSVVIVLRHEAIPYAMGDDLWAKYKFGEMFKINDPRTKEPATRNPYWETKPDDFKIPGIGPVALGIRDLQASGILICVCDVALTVYSAVAGMNTKMDAGEVKKEWLAGLLPSVQPMPSGVWAVGRAQEHGCSYCFAG
jgi:hypothetical protein